MWLPLTYLRLGWYHGAHFASVEVALGTADCFAVDAEHLPNLRAPHHQMNAEEARLTLYLRLRRARAATGGVTDE